MDDRHLSEQEDRELLIRLVREPSVVHRSDRAQRALVDEFRRVGLESELVQTPQHLLWNHPEFSAQPSESNVLNVVGRLPGHSGGRSLLLIAHIDTEPVPQPGEWSSPPFEATERSGRMYGLGTADAKAGLVSILGTVRALRSARVELPGDLTLLSVQGKGGGGIGMLAAMMHGVRADAAIYCHPAETGKGLTQIKTGSRGVLQIAVDVPGRTPPALEIGTPASADPSEGVNAIWKAHKIAASLRDWAEQKGILFNLGMVRGGDHPMVVPDSARLSASIWFTQGTWRGWFQEIATFLQESPVIREDPWLRVNPPGVTPVGMRASAVQVGESEPIVKTLHSAIAMETGTAPDLYLHHTASDIRFPSIVSNIPCLGIGATAGNFYGPNEWVDLRSMHHTTRVLIRAVLNWMNPLRT